MYIQLQPSGLKGVEHGSVSGCEAFRMTFVDGLLSLCDTVIQCNPRAALTAGSEATRYLWPTDMEGTLAQERRNNH